MKRVQRACLALGLAAIAGCQTGISRHGTLVSSAEYQSVDPGADTKESVESRLGSPPVTGIGGDTVWIYVSERKQRSAVFKPKTVGREIAVIRFDGDVVAGIARYTMEDGRRFAFESATTATQGRRQTLLEQVFGAIGVQLDVDSSGPAY